MVREPTSSMEAVARGSSSSMEGGHLIGKVLELQIGVAVAITMQMQVVPKDLAKPKAQRWGCNLKKKETQIQVEKDAPLRDGNLETCRSVRLVKKKTKEQGRQQPIPCCLESACKSLLFSVL
uniref:Uncharacterized protein n=1 Tax=Triticum urartu TaxID=4572 RepID=A0A8R7QQP0_TRIUA